MCADVDYFPHLFMQNTLTQYDRRNSWTNSISSSSSSSNTTTITSTSWLERKLFSHFKRFFRRKSLSYSNRCSSSTIDNTISISSTNEQLIPQEEKLKEEEEQEEEEVVEQILIKNDKSSPSSSSDSSNQIDFLYDYNRLLTRCIERREHDRIELILRCQTPISIPHADLLLNQSHTIVLNWKSYTRLFRSLTRDENLFQLYLNEYFPCQTSINSQREQLILNIRTNKNTFDNVLKKFLDEYVTCLLCQTAQTHLIKLDRIWRIECQLCGSQRTVKRLKWKHHQHQ